MLKIRIYELAKRLGIRTKIVLSELSKLGVKGKVHSSSIDPDLAGKLEDILVKMKGLPPEQKKPVEESVKPSVKQAPEPQKEPELSAEEKKTETTEVKKPGLPDEEELLIPERFRKEIEVEKIEKFKTKPGMQRAFQTIRKIEPKRWEQRPGKRGGRSRPYHVEEKKPQIQLVAPRKKTLKLQEGTTVKEFAELISVKLSDVIKKFMVLGYTPTINQPVEPDAALLIAEGQRPKP